MKRKEILRELKRLLLIILGSLITAFNINTFVKSANIIPGGFSGLALLIQHIVNKFFSFNIPYSALTWTLNAIPIYIGFRFIGKRFTFYSVVMIVLSGILVDFVPGLSLTNDVLLCAIFGGIIDAVSIYCCLMADSSSGGTDFISIYISERTGKSAWNYILAGNCCVLLTAGIFLGWNAALYSIIFQYVTTQGLNFLYKKYKKTTLLIVTDKAQEIYKIINQKTHHDGTIFKGKGCYQGAEHEILYSVVSSSESGKLEKEIREADPEAFINVLESKEIIGRFFKRTND